MLALGLKLINMIHFPFEPVSPAGGFLNAKSTLTFLPKSN